MIFHGGGKGGGSEERGERDTENTRAEVVDRIKVKSFVQIL